MKIGKKNRLQLAIEHLKRNGNVGTFDTFAATVVVLHELTRLDRLIITQNAELTLLRVELAHLKATDSNVIL